MTDADPRPTVRPLSPAEVAAVEQAWPRLVARSAETRQEWDWSAWEREPELAAVRSLGLGISPDALNRLAREAAKAGR